MPWVPLRDRMNVASKKSRGRAQQTKVHRRKKTRR